MRYRAVGNRCAVDFLSLGLSITQSQALTLLKPKGFHKIDVDIIALARTYVGKSEYRRSARLYEAPFVFDCSSLIKWLYGQKGIWLPRRTIQQRECGEAVNLANIIAGDVVFVSGVMDYYFDEPLTGVGHVGIATGNGNIISAENIKAGVVESSIQDFLANRKFRGARRYMPLGSEIVTLMTPTEREVEFDDDIKWIVLQLL